MLALVAPFEDERWIDVGPCGLDVPGVGRRRWIRGAGRERGRRAGARSLVLVGVAGRAGDGNHDDDDDCDDDCEDREQLAAPGWAT